ncbi:MAG: hypothetical protein PHX61_01925 [Alphaproteobacteria bacterium]|nr:hypothetical protein [Alphaproteobacteria bacterium]
MTISEMIAEFKISLAFIGSIIKTIWNTIPTILNLCTRPKAKIEIKNHNIIVTDNDQAQHHYSYPTISISFEKDVKIDVRSIHINNETLHCMMSRDPIYLRQNQNSQEPLTITNNDLMVFIHQNWSTLTQQACLFEIAAHEQQVLPLYLREGMSNCLFNTIKKPRIFFPQKKLCLSMNIDGKDYQYSLNLLEVSKVVINNLAFQ